LARKKDVVGVSPFQGRIHLPEPTRGVAPGWRMDAPLARQDIVGVSPFQGCIILPEPPRGVAPGWRADAPLARQNIVGVSPFQGCIVLPEPPRGVAPGWRVDAPLARQDIVGVSPFQGCIILPESPRSLPRAGGPMHPWRGISVAPKVQNPTAQGIALGLAHPIIAALKGRHPLSNHPHAVSKISATFPAVRSSSFRASKMST